MLIYLHEGLDSISHELQGKHQNQVEGMTYEMMMIKVLHFSIDFTVNLT